MLLSILGYMRHLKYKFVKGLQGGKNDKSGTYVEYATQRRD